MSLKLVHSTLHFGTFEPQLNSWTVKMAHLGLKLTNMSLKIAHLSCFFFFTHIVTKGQFDPQVTGLMLKGISRLTFDHQQYIHGSSPTKTSQKLILDCKMRLNYFPTLPHIDDKTKRVYPVIPLLIYQLFFLWLSK